MSTAAVLVCALVLDAVFGEPDWLWSRLLHPAVLMGRLIGALDKKFNTGTNRKLRGIMCIAFAVLLASPTGWVISLFGPIAEMIVCAILLAQKSLVQHVSAVAEGVRISLREGRRAVAMIVSRDTSNMDTSQTVRAAIESAAENLSDGVIAPAFWFLIGGLPGLIIYKVVNTADSMIGYRTTDYREFGWAAARLDDLLNLIPARLTALFLAITGRTADVSGIVSDARLHRSPNAGWPEAAMSRALGIALSGPRAYDGKMQEFPWVNQSGKRMLSAVDIDASIAMLWKAWGLMLAALILMTILF